jgi:hypothetical protein
VNISNWLQKERLKVAWALLPADKKAAIQPLIDAAHEKLRIYQTTGKAPPHDPTIPHLLTLAKSALTDDADGTVAALPELKPGDIQVDVDSVGVNLEHREISATGSWLAGCGGRVVGTPYPWQTRFPCGNSVGYEHSRRFSDSHRRKLWNGKLGYRC